MSTFLSSISSVINFLLSSLSQVTSTLTNNIIFQIVIGIFLFTLVIDIISSFIHLRKNKNSDE